MSGVVLALGAMGAFALGAAAREQRDAEVFYHGTSTALLTPISRHGLRPPGDAPGAATWAGFEGYDTEPDARDWVYATRLESVAWKYADDTVARRKRRGLAAGDPIVLRIRLPVGATVGIDPVLPTSGHAVTLRGLPAIPPSALDVMDAQGNATPLLRPLPKPAKGPPRVERARKREVEALTSLPCSTCRAPVGVPCQRPNGRGSYGEERVHKARREAALRAGIWPQRSAAGSGNAARGLTIQETAGGRHRGFTASVDGTYAGELWAYEMPLDAVLTRPCVYGLGDLIAWLERRDLPRPRALHRVTTVTIEPRFRRQGVARALYERALQHAHTERAALLADGCWETGQTAPQARAVWKALARDWMIFEDRVGWGVRWDDT